jgi:hypothetical protein
MQEEDLSAALDSCGGDVLLAINKLSSLHLAPPAPQGVAQPEPPANHSEHVAADSAHQHQQNVPSTPGEWVEVFVQEMASSRTLDDARQRAGGLLGAFELFVSQRKDRETQSHLGKMGEQLEHATRINNVLKQAVTIQHSKNLELQEQLKQSEAKNYALTVHLKQMDQQANHLMTTPHIF